MVMKVGLGIVIVIREMFSIGFYAQLFVYRVSPFIRIPSGHFASLLKAIASCAPFQNPRVFQPRVEPGKFPGFICVVLTPLEPY
jgi:hypothetical protein